MRVVLRRTTSYGDGVYDGRRPCGRREGATRERCRRTVGGRGFGVRNSSRRGGRHEVRPRLKNIRAAESERVYDLADLQKPNRKYRTDGDHERRRGNSPAKGEAR